MTQSEGNECLGIPAQKGEVTRIVISFFIPHYGIIPIKEKYEASIAKVTKKLKLREFWDVMVTDCPVFPQEFEEASP